MKLKDYLEQLVKEIKKLDTPSSLSGEDSNFPDFWEEYKHQIKHIKSFYWDAYVETTIQVADSLVFQIPDKDIPVIWSETRIGRRTNSQFVSMTQMRENIRTELLTRLAAKAQKEKIIYSKPDFDFCYYWGPGFVVYARILKRTGHNTVKVRAYSVATTRFGEEGDFYFDDIGGILSEEEFNKCQILGWPENPEDLDNALGR